MAARCPSCRKNVAKNAPFCTSCGMRLGSVPVLHKQDAPLPSYGVSPQSSSPAMIGELIGGRYRIVSPIASGNMGEVWRGVDERLSNRPCAIKTVLLGGATQVEQIERMAWFAREADVLAGLRHPSICDIRDVIAEGESRYLILELIEGKTLAQGMATRGQPGLPTAEVLPWAAQLCNALAYLHSQSPPIIFRDLKPENIMERLDHSVVLIDFGIARTMAFAAGTAIGTGGYAPPEQYQGLADARSDIYSLAATLHYLLTGRDPTAHPPFSFPTARTLAPSISREVDAALSRALILDPTKRFSSIREFERAIGLATGNTLSSTPSSLPIVTKIAGAVKGTAQGVHSTVASSAELMQSRITGAADQSQHRIAGAVDYMKNLAKEREEAAERERQRKVEAAARQRTWQYEQKLRALVHDEGLRNHISPLHEAIRYVAVWGGREIVLGEKHLFAQAIDRGIAAIERHAISYVTLRPRGLFAARRWDIIIVGTTKSGILTTVQSEMEAQRIKGIIDDWVRGSHDKHIKRGKVRRPIRRYHPGNISRRSTRKRSHPLGIAAPIE